MWPARLFCVICYLFLLKSANCWIRTLKFPNVDDHWYRDVAIDVFDDIPEPSELLSYVHDANSRVAYIHHLSQSLLRTTKSLVSFEPRSPRPRAPVGVSVKLSSLQRLKQDDVRDFLHQQGIAVPPPRNITCHPAYQYYRTLDGSCNNLHRPCWGKAEEPYQRWLPPDYANGIDEFRRSSSGFNLPSPRQVYQWVSSQFEQSIGTTYPTFNNLLMIWGQMLAHDIILTPTVKVKIWDGKEFKDESPECCNTTRPHADCMPIVMNYEDTFYPRGHCMNIIRSSSYSYSPSSCTPLALGKPREQLNQLTAFIDASIVYGSSDAEMRKLREDGGRGAKLIMDYTSGWSYPLRKNATKCKATRGRCDKRCFLTGERRANENPVLGAVHTLWAREHNRIVDVLRSRGWDEETLFHVVRKIIGALLQHLTYKEYLPLVLGSHLTNVMQLSVPTSDFRYDPGTNPTIYNAFATAAFRFGHSMVDSRQKRRGHKLQGSPLLSHDFFSMDDFCSSHQDPVGNLLDGQLDQKVQMVDCRFSKQLTNHLFAKTSGAQGLDLFSINIQRGRDHGLPPYNKWREACGLPKANDFGGLRGSIPDYIVERLQFVYGPGNVNDIDLFVGGVSEYPVNDGILGPTFTCIVAHQFRNLKFGDRFWYENKDHPGAFTPSQIEAIRKTTLAALLCRNSDIQRIQPMAFLAESNSNPKLPCDLIKKQGDLDLSIWP